MRQHKNFRVIIRSVYTVPFSSHDNCKSEQNYCRIKSVELLKTGRTSELNTVSSLSHEARPENVPRKGFRKGLHSTKQTKIHNSPTLCLQTYVFVKRAECNIDTSDHEHAHIPMKSIYQDCNECPKASFMLFFCYHAQRLSQLPRVLIQLSFI